VEEYEAAIVRQMFAWYLEQGATLGTIARRLVRAGLANATFEQRRRLVELIFDRVISSQMRRSRSVTSFSPHRKALTNRFAICVQTI